MPSCLVGECPVDEMDGIPHRIPDSFKGSVDDNGDGEFHKNEDLEIKRSDNTY